MSRSMFPRTSVVLALLLSACTPDDGNGNGNGDDDDDIAPGSVKVVSTAAETTSFSQAVISAQFSGPANVAAACVRRDDPAEVHLLEVNGQTNVDFEFAGLLHATDYDCSVAAVEPPSEVVKLSFRTPDPPEELASADVTSDPNYTMTGAYTVMNVRPECLGIHKNYIAVLDPDGNNRWRYDLPAGMNIGVEVKPDGPNKFLWGGGKNTIGAPAVIDVNDGKEWKLEFDGIEDAEFHHEAARLADGRVLSVEDTYDEGWAAFRLRLSDESGVTSWLWDVKSAVETGWLSGGSAEEEDPHHLNWADVVDTPDGLVAYGSLCFSFLTIAIDVATSTPLWKFGPYDGDFTLVDEQGNVLPDQTDFPECQHGLSTDGTNLLVYDNGFNREYTRAVEYKLDTVNMTATKTWEWLDEGYWEKYHGNVDWLTPDHNRVLMGQGNNDCGNTSERHSQVVEIDRETNTVVHRLVLRELYHWIYRAHRVDGCEVFANAKYCPALATRVETLSGVLDL